jgi:hypothetical protein
MSIENYLNVTRILINPIIPEIIAFKERYIFVFVFNIFSYIFRVLNKHMLSVLQLLVLFVLGLTQDHLLTKIS